MEEELGLQNFLLPWLLEKEQEYGFGKFETNLFLCEKIQPANKVI